MPANSVKTAFLKALNGNESPFILNSAAEVLIGRDFNCQLRLSSAGGVSRRHAAIRWVAAQNTYVLSDLGSANGTYVNGQRLQGEHSLRSGDRIQLGATGPEFLFEDPTLPATAVDLNPRPIQNLPLPLPIAPAPQPIAPAPQPVVSPAVIPPAAPAPSPSRSNLWKWIVGGLIGVGAFVYLSQVIEMGSFRTGSNPPPQQPSPVASSPAASPAAGGKSQPAASPAAGETASSKNFDNFRVCADPGNQVCQSDTPLLDARTTQGIVVNATYRDVPANSKIDVSLRYTGANGDTDSAQLDALDVGGDTSGGISLSLNAPPNGWFPGAYEVTLAVQGDSASAATKIFLIAGNGAQNLTQPSSSRPSQNSTIQLTGELRRSP